MAGFDKCPNLLSVLDDAWRSIPRFLTLATTHFNALSGPTGTPFVRAFGEGLGATDWVDFDVVDTSSGVLFQDLVDVLTRNRGEWSYYPGTLEYPERFEVTDSILGLVDITLSPDGDFRVHLSVGGVNSGADAWTIRLKI